MSDNPTNGQVKRPNLLLLFPDQWRGDWLGAYPGAAAYGRPPVKTPNIDALAARGVCFTRHYTNSPLCAPARACFALGLRRHRTGVWNNHDDTHPRETTLFNRLQAQGYRTLTCGKNDLHKGSNDFHDSGWTSRLAAYGFADAVDQRGKMDSGRPEPMRPGAYLAYLRAHGLLQAHIDDYEARKQSPVNQAIAPWPTPLERQHFTDDFCGRSALDLLDRTPVGQPWCLWVNFPGPHDPHDPPRELQQRYDGMDFPPPIHGEDKHDGQAIEHQQLRRNYAANCQGIDDWVGWIVDAVERRGELDNTVIIFFSDHGEMLGDHGRWQKSVWYEPSANVPLIVAGPGIAQGKVSRALIELIDVHATCLELAGAAVPSEIDGRGFANLLVGDDPNQPHREQVVSSLGPWRMIAEARWKLVHLSDEAASGGDDILLYDLENDPIETRNVAKQHPRVAERLMRELEAQSPAKLRPQNGRVVF